MEVFRTERNHVAHAFLAASCELGIIGLVLILIAFKHPWTAGPLIIPASLLTIVLLIAYRTYVPMEHYIGKAWWIAVVAWLGVASGALSVLLT